MDVNDMRSAFTILSLLVFFGIVVWSCSRRRRSEFDAAAQLPFADDRRAEQASTDRARSDRSLGE